MRRTCLISTVIALFLCTGNAFAQDSKRVLFIGNSYTEVNNLPQMVANVAQSMGDEVVYNSNTPGVRRQPSAPRRPAPSPHCREP